MSCRSCVQVFDHIDGISGETEIIHGLEEAVVAEGIEGAREVYLDVVDIPPSKTGVLECHNKEL